MRATIAGNLAKLLARDYSMHDNVTKQQRALAEASGVGFGTIQRLMKSEVGGNLETLETLALHFNLLVYQFMLPNLDVANPQTVKGAEVAEQRLYASMRKQKRPVSPKQPESVTS